MSKKATRVVSSKEINNALQDEEILQFEMWYPEYQIKDYNDYIKKKEEAKLEEFERYMEEIQALNDAEYELLYSLSLF